MKNLLVIILFLFVNRVSAEETKDDTFFSVSVSVKSSDSMSVSSQTAKKIETDISNAAEIRLYKKFFFSDDAKSSDVIISISEEQAFGSSDIFIVSADVKDAKSGKILFRTKSSPVNINGSDKASFELASAVTGYLESYRKIVIAERAKKKKKNLRRNHFLTEDCFLTEDFLFIKLSAVSPARQNMHQR